MNIKTLQKKEYEIFLYGFSIEDIYSEIKNIIENVVTKNARKLEKSIYLKGGKFDDVEKQRISNEIDSLINLHIEFVLEPFKHIQYHLQKYLCIPDNVLLPDDIMHLVHCTEEDVVRMNQEIQYLEKKIIRAKVLKAQLKEEVKIYKENEDFLKKLEQYCSVMNKQNYECLFQYEKLTALLKKFSELQEVNFSFTKNDELKFHA